MEKASPAPLLENPYFFCEKGEASWKEVSSAIAEGLYKAGKLDEPTTKTLPEDLYGDVLSQCKWILMLRHLCGRRTTCSSSRRLLTSKSLSAVTAPVIGLNSRSRALRLRDLGWEPKEKDWKSSYLEDELPEILKEDNSSFTGYKVR